MITHMALTTIWSTDQERDLEFFTETLGFDKRYDMMMGESRWVTVSPRNQPELQFALMRPDGPGLDPESSEALTTLVSKGVIGGGAFHTDDIRATYAELREKGVEFLQEPVERPYGIEAIFRDPTGNWYSLTQVRPDGLDLTKPWA